jgi:hypothetical protein
MKKSDAKKIEKAMVSSACALGGVGLIIHGLHNLMKSEGKAMKILLGIFEFTTGIVFGVLAFMKSFDMLTSNHEIQSDSSEGKEEEEVDFNLPCIIGKIINCLFHPLSVDCALGGCVDNSSDHS